MNNIAQQGLDELAAQGLTLNVEAENPDGLLVRSAKLHDWEFGDRLAAIARAGVEALEAAFAPATVEERDLVTGFEAYCLVPLAPLEAKRRCCGIEDRHPLGRLMDVDVLERVGQTGVPVPVSRERIGLPPRKCLLCDRPARECIRLRSHTPEQLLSKMEQMVKDYNV